MASDEDGMAGEGNDGNETAGMRRDEPEDQDNAARLRQQGITLQDDKRFEEALALYEHALASDPSPAAALVAWRGKSAAYHSLGRYTESGWVFVDYARSHSALTYHVSTYKSADSSEPTKC